MLAKLAHHGLAVSALQYGEAQVINAADVVAMRAADQATVHRHTMAGGERLEVRHHLIPLFARHAASLARASGSHVSV